MKYKFVTQHFLVFLLMKKTDANLRLNLTVSLYEHVQEKEIGK